MFFYPKKSFSVFFVLAGCVLSPAAYSTDLSAQSANNSEQARIPAHTLITPELKLAPNQTLVSQANSSSNIVPQQAIALTFDLCMGHTDMRIFNVLVEHKIPATFFVTKRWLENKANKQVLEEIRKYPQLFEIANHGGQHLVPVDDAKANIYGLRKAHTTKAICLEALEGLEAIKRAGLQSQISSYYWYRGAGAVYTMHAYNLLHQAGFSIAGFSVNGDFGASLSSHGAYQQILQSKEGDVVIAHMNQPNHAAGQGVAQAIIALQKRNYKFLTLSQHFDHETNLPQRLLSWHRGKLLTKTMETPRRFYPNCNFIN